jgi:putative transposase
MLKEAFSKFDNLKGLILHSDQGWQYQMAHYREVLNNKGIIQSMSRKGNCLDNSIIENFFGIMKNEMFYGNQHQFKSLKQLENEILEYINYYNKERITDKLKGLSPWQYRLQSSN